MVKNWSGSDVGEFMTRLYLGEINEEEFTVNYCPSNVRNPRWKGLDEKGLKALEDLLMAAVPNEALNPQDLLSCAESFLLKEHRWPSDKENSTATKTSFEDDSFGNLGYNADIAKVLASVRRSRIGSLSAQDVVAMATLPENDERDQAYVKLATFYENIGIAAF